MSASVKASFGSYRAVMVAVLAVGAMVSIAAYVMGRRDETRNA